MKYNKTTYWHVDFPIPEITGRMIYGHVFHGVDSLWYDITYPGYEGDISSRVMTVPDGAPIEGTVKVNRISIGVGGEEGKILAVLVSDPDRDEQLMFAPNAHAIALTENGIASLSLKDYAFTRKHAYGFVFTDVGQHKGARVFYDFLLAESVKQTAGEIDAVYYAIVNDFMPPRSVVSGQLPHYEEGALAIPSGVDVEVGCSFCKINGKIKLYRRLKDG